ncbi:O-acyltransferase like protein-like [Bolinopsis microptera]|uniref:O-acyltransferase like protein-like n=1 Tax=Bolinopsis microptera TaxID=2820187 RepID=UPI003079C098
MSSNLTSNINTIFASFEGFGNATKCTAKLSQLTSGLASFNPESIAFIDALGKPGPGVTTGNFLLLGNYEMCGTGALENKATGYKYENCVVSAAFTLGGYRPLALTWTGCSPPECKSNNDLQNVFKHIADLINKSGIIHTDPSTWTIMCDVKQEFDVGAYAAVTIVSLFVILVVVGTLWHLLEPIIISILEQGKDDTTILIDAEENPHEDVDKQVPSTEVREKYKTSNQPEWLPGRLAKCFALQRTMETLFTTTTKPGQVLCLNGIRVLSINWVVLGHVYAYSFSSVGGYSYLTELIKRRNFMLVYNGLPSVDSFFALSGFLVTYLLLKQLAKRGGLTPLQWIAFYVHRYVRLTMPYLVAMLIEGWLYRLVMTGPRAQQITTTDMGSHKMCEQYWYTNLLYINNFVPWKATGACLKQGWYLANDMQFFLIAPLFIVLLFGTPLLGVLATGGTMICSAVSAAVITAHYHLGPASTADTNQNEMWLLYNKPWIRITPYLVGILGGWFYWKWGKQITEGVKTLPEWLKVMCATPIWAVTAAVEYAVVFGLYDDVQNLPKGNPGEVESVFYQSLARIAWSLSLTIQILLCQFGLGGFINSLLSWNGWQILSRLTYSVFLLHIGLITVLFGQMRHTLFLNPDFEFAVFYLGTLAISYLSAAVLYLTVEQPVANLEGISYRKSI